MMVWGRDYYTLDTPLRYILSMVRVFRAAVKNDLPRSPAQCLPSCVAEVLHMQVKVRKPESESECTPFLAN